MIEVEIHDNFLEDPGYYIDFANQCKFFTHEEHRRKTGRKEGWPGLRTLNLTDDLPELVEKLNKSFNIDVGRLNFYRHPYEKFKNHPGEGRDHVDAAWEFSGVIYLQGSDGTVIGEQHVPFQFNRCVCFDAMTPHHPLFGSSDRLVITFFSDLA